MYTNLLTGILLGFSGCYYFRRFLFRKIFIYSFFIIKNILSLYTYYKKYKKDTNNILYIRSCKTIDDYRVEEYEISVVDKNHKIIFVSKDGKSFDKDISNFKRNILTKLQNKMMIVHCSITNENGDIIIDITNVFRFFCYYFDTDMEIRILFRYIQSMYSMLNIYDNNLTIYLNDNEFTELVYKIQESEYMTFSKILSGPC